MSEQPTYKRGFIQSASSITVVRDVSSQDCAIIHVSNLLEKSVT